MERLGNRDRTEAHRLSEREVSESNPAAQPSGNFTGCLPPPHKATARQATPLDMTKRSLALHIALWKKRRAPSFTSTWTASMPRLRFATGLHCAASP